MEGNPLSADGIREVLDSDKLQNTIIGADTANLAVAVGQELDRRLVQARAGAWRSLSLKTSGAFHIRLLPNQSFAASFSRTVLPGLGPQSTQ